MSKTSTTPLKHTDDPVHVELDKQKHIAAHGGDVEAAGYEKEEQTDLLDVDVTSEQIKDAKQKHLDYVNQKREKEKEELKVKLDKNERIQKYTSSGLYNENELNIIGEEILKEDPAEMSNLSPIVVSEEQAKLYEQQERDWLFKKYVSHHNLQLESSNLESVEIISEVLGYDKLHGTTLEDELDAVLSAVNSKNIHYEERDGIIKIDKNSVLAQNIEINEKQELKLNEDIEAIDNKIRELDKSINAEEDLTVSKKLKKEREELIADRKEKLFMSNGMVLLGVDVYIDKATGQTVDKDSLTLLQDVKLNPENEFFESFYNGEKGLEEQFYGPLGEQLYFSKKWNTVYEEHEYEGLFKNYVIEEHGQAVWNSFEIDDIESAEEFIERGITKEESDIRTEFIEKLGISTSDEMEREYLRTLWGNEMGGYESGRMSGFKKAPVAVISRNWELSFPNDYTYWSDPTRLSGRSDYVTVYSPITGYGMFFEKNKGMQQQSGNMIFRRTKGGYGSSTIMTDDQFARHNEKYSYWAQKSIGDATILNNAFSRSQMNDLVTSSRQMTYHSYNYDSRQYSDDPKIWNSSKEAVENRFNKYLDGTGYSLQIDLVGEKQSDLKVKFSIFLSEEDIDGGEPRLEFSSIANGTNSPDTDVLQYIGENITPQKLEIIDLREVGNPHKEIELKKEKKKSEYEETTTDKEVFTRFSKDIPFPEVTKRDIKYWGYSSTMSRKKLKTKKDVVNSETSVTDYINKSIIENGEIDKEKIVELLKEIDHYKVKEFRKGYGWEYTGEYTKELDSVATKYFEFAKLHQRDYNDNKIDVRYDVIRGKVQNYGEKLYEKRGIAQNFDFTNESHIITIDGKESSADKNLYFEYNERMRQAEELIIQKTFEKDIVDPIKKGHELGYSFYYTQGDELLSTSDPDFDKKINWNKNPEFGGYKWEGRGEDPETIYTTIGTDAKGLEYTLYDQLFDVGDKVSTVLGELESTRIEYINNIIDAYDIDEGMAHVMDEKGITRDFGQNWRTRFIIGLDNVVFGIPALFGHKGAQDQLRQNEMRWTTMKQYEWGESPWYQNVAMVFADQGANMLFFVGTMGTGSALNFSRQASMLTASGGVGLQSGGDKHTQLLTQRQNAELAKAEIKELETTFGKGLMSQGYLDKRVHELNKIVAYGEMSDLQHWSAVTSTVVIEGGFTYAFGSVGRLNTSNRVVNMFTGGNRSGFAQMGNYSGTKQIWDHSKSALSSARWEVIEEELIYTSTALTDAAFLGRKVDFSQIKKVAIDAAIMSGGTNATSLTYDGIMNHGTRIKLRNEIIKLDKQIDNINDQLSELPGLNINQKEKDTRRQNLMNEYLDLEMQRVGKWSEAHIDILGLDEKSQKDIIRNYQDILSLHREAGINMGDGKTTAEINTALEYHAHKLNQERSGKGDEWLKNYNKTKNYVDEVVLQNFNEETAKQSIYGPEHKDKRNSTIKRLKRNKERAEAYNKANSKQKLFMELQFMYEENLNRNANVIKNDKRTNADGKTIADRIEEIVFKQDPSYKINGTEYENDKEFKEELDRLKNEGKLNDPEFKYNIIVNNDEATGNQVAKMLEDDGATEAVNTTLANEETKINQEEWKKQNNRKRISKDQKEQLEKWYKHVARQRISANTGRDFTKFEKGEISVDKINQEIFSLTGKQLIVVDRPTIDELQDQLDFLVEEGELSAAEYKKVMEALRDGVGAIVGNKFLTVDPKARQLLNSKDVNEQSKALIGAVWLHETGHYLDNSTKTREELNEKAFLLSKGLVENSKFSGVINDDAIKRLEQNGGYLIDGNVMTSVTNVYNMLQDADVDKVVKPDGTTKKDQINTWLDEYIREAEYSLQSEEHASIYKKLLKQGRRFGKIRSWKGDYTVKSGKDAIFEVVSYIEAFRNNELSAAYKAQLKQAEGKVGLVGDEMKTQQSRQVEINNLVRNQEGEIVTKDQYDMDQVGDVAMLLTPGNEDLNGSIVGLGFRIEGNEVYGFPKDEFIQSVKDQLSTAVMNYNPETEYQGVITGDLSGWLARHIMLKKPGVLEDFKNRREALDAAKEPGIEEEVIDTPEGTVIFAKRLGFEESVIGKDDNGKEITRNEFDLIVEDIFNEIVETNPKSYKDVKDLVKGGILVKILNKVAKEFGVNPNKLINDTSLTVSERLSIQRKIRSLTAKTLLNALPEGFNNVAETTGLPNVLLNAKNPETGEPNLLYNKQEQRAKTGVKQRVGRRFIFPPKKKDKGGTGPFLQVINFVNDINESHFLDLFGITPVGVESKFRTEDRSVDSPLRAIVVQVATLIANQSTRKIANERGLFGLETIASGKADVQYSKKIAQSGVEQLGNDYNEGRGTFLEVLNQLGVSKVDEDPTLFKEVFYQGLNIAYPNTQWTYDGVNYKNELYKEYNKYRELFVERFKEYEKSTKLDSEFNLIDYLTLEAMQDPEFVLAKVFGLGPLRPWIENEVNRENQRSYNRNLIAPYIKELNKRGVFDNEIIKAAKELGITPAELQALVRFIGLKAGFEGGFDKDSKGRYRSSQSIFKNKKFYFENFLTYVVSDLKRTDKKGVLKKGGFYHIRVGNKTVKVKVPVYYKYATSGKQKTEKQHIVQRDKNNNPILSKELITEMEQREELSEEALLFVDDLYAIGAELSKDPNTKWNKYNFAILIDQMNKDMGTPLRIGAAPMWLALDAPTAEIKDENGKKTFEWEHGGPARKVNLMFIDKHWNNADISLDDIKKTFQVGVLHRDFNDNVSRFFKERMNFGFKIGDSPFGRWNSPLLLGGPAHLLINWKTGEIVGQRHVDYYNKTLNHRKGTQQSIAVQNSRLINHNTERKGMSAWDFDDTLATTKSGVRATIPNPEGVPQPSRKVIFLAGGAGSGKSNVVNKLNLEKQGFKIVNQDISLEWLKKNNGLPENMNDLTKEQRSTLGKLGYQARQIAKGKMMKYQGNAEGIVVDGTGASLNAMQNLVDEFTEKGYDVSMLFVETSLKTALERNKARAERSLLDKIVIKNHEAVQGNKKAFKGVFGNRFMQVKTDELTQDSPMPSKLVEKVDDFVNSYKKIRLDAEEFATQGAEILEQGGVFDFSEFNVVTEGAQGPMFKTAFDRAKKYGTEDTYVLTARPQESARPIQEFLASQGLDIPLGNITGLGNSTGKAKAEWILQKYSEGYNDIFFADDAMQNVEAVKDILDQLDVKSKVIQAKIQQSRKINFEMDRIIPVTKAGDNTGIENTKNVGTLTADGVYSNIQFSKKHRGEYESLISKNRPDLVEEGLVSQSVDQMFDLVNNLNIPTDKRRKYEKIMTKWLATSVMKLPEDNYKLQDAVELAEKNKEDIFAYSNPNQIIEKYAGKAKGPIDPNTVEQFTEDKSFENKQYGITQYIVEETKEAQDAVRKVVDTHWGENSNPWCLTQKKDGKLTEDSWENWIRYNEGPKRIVFQNGKLLSFYANMVYWDRMDNSTDEPVVNIKKGRVTEKAEIVPIGDGKYQEFVLETRTVSEDGNTVETLYNKAKEYDQVYEYPAGTRKVENRVNGQTVKETQYRPDGTIQRETSFKNGKAVETRTMFKGRTSSINNGLGDMSAKDVVPNFGDLIAHEITEGNTDYWFGKIHLESQGIKGVDAITEIGFSTKVGEFELMDVMKRVDGKLRLDLVKVAKIDPEMRGLPPGIQFSKLGKELGIILEATTGVKAKKLFSKAQAKIEGSRFKFRSIIPASAQDFAGLLYNFLGKGKIGEQQMEFFKNTLIDPFSRGINELNAAKQSAANNYKNLLKQFPEVKKKLNKYLGKYKGVPKHVSKFTVDQAIRVYLWNKAGFDVPGLSKRDLKALDNFVKSDADIQSFADHLGLVSKRETGYAKPSEYWLVENIASDLTSDGAIGEIRADFLAEFIQNKNEIFSEENLNKIEAIYGSKFRESLENILHRMETGRNRERGGGRLMNGYLNWLNGSVGAIMFFNIRSAALQTISAVNYLNWTDNNPLKAATAFANQKQFWSDFVFLFNSDYLKQRRAGNQRGVNEAELSAAVKGKGPVEQAKAAIRYLLKIGFLPTQIADSFAISSGGASFYRNRIKSYLKQGMSKAEAEERAFLDFQETTEVSQQSARPDMISQQQANPLGRLILAFQNTPMQYGRIMNKAARDLANNRGDFKTHTSKIIYYGFIANLLFQSLQTAIWAVIGDEDEEEFDKKKQRIFNGMFDTLLTPIGYGGKAISTIKNTIQEFYKQRAKSLDDNYFTQSDHTYTILQLLNFSPPIGSKTRKIYQSIQTERFNRDVIAERGLTLDNPVWNAIGNTIEGFTNIPLGRLSNKALNIDNAMDSTHEWWQRVALVSGWSTWSLGIKDPDLVALGEDIKERKKQEKKMNKERDKANKKREKLKEKYPDKTDIEIDEAVITEQKTKQIFDLNKREQVQIIEDLKLNPKNYPKEKNRVDIIMEYYNKDPEKMDSTLTAIENYVPSELEQRSIDLFKATKKEQVNMLMDLGLSSRRIKKLKYEEDRVNKIIELQNKRKSK